MHHQQHEHSLVTARSMEQRSGVKRCKESARCLNGASLTLPGVGVSSHLFLRGVGPSAGLPGVGVASQRLPAPGVAPGVASQCAAGVAPGVASQLLVAGVASIVSQSATLDFLLQQISTCQQRVKPHAGVCEQTDRKSREH